MFTWKDTHLSHAPIHNIWIYLVSLVAADMPIPLDRMKTRAMRSLFDKALECVQNEFAGLNTERQYQNAFARLLKPDPLRRVLMMGTSGRDLFTPPLHRAITRFVPAGGHIVDVGAGNGQTFAHVAESVPSGAMISIVEPDEQAVDDYRAFLSTQRHLRTGMVLASGFEQIDDAARRTGVPLPIDGAVDLVLALQMVYFLSDLPASLIRMARFLKPGGAIFLVFADETASYSGVSTRFFIESGGDTGDNEQHLEAPAERWRLLAAPEEGAGEILGVLHAALPGASFELDSVCQPNRLYGHSLADLIALGNLSVLGRVHGTAKFMASCSLLLDEPERVDLRIEDEGPRSGMWSVQSPQRVAVIRRCAGGPAARSLAENPVTTGRAAEAGSGRVRIGAAGPTGREMPVRIDRPAAKTLADRFDEALDLVRNEFEKLDRRLQYRNAYARVLKHDPLERVPAVGADQYDRLASMLRQLVADTVPPGGQILDVGAGDGETLALFASVVPAGVTISVVDPDPDAVSSYRATLNTHEHLRPGMSLVAGFEEMDEAAWPSAGARDGLVNLVVALDVAYFLSDLPGSLSRMALLLKPGGAVFVSVADETVGYTGAALRSFIDSGGDTGDNDRHLAAIRERPHLLAVPGEGGGGILKVLDAERPGGRFEVETVRHPTRLYAHTLADLIALANISTLSRMPGTTKFISTCNLLQHEPEAVDLRVENDGPRQGMWSVAQPSLTTTIRRKSP